VPRLSLYRPQKGNDYRFIDKTVWEMFQVGGTDVLVHKYLGPSTTTGDAVSPTTPEYTGGPDPFQIQDLLFLENRDRKYDPDIYQLRGVYNLQDIDFNLSQFGLFLQNDTVFITFHINDTVEKLGRKIMSGDVIELPHLKDEYAANDLQFALKRYYVIEEVNRAAEGFSVTWYPHLYRAKCKPLVDSQEFKDILDGIADSDNYKGPWEEAITYYPGDVIAGPDGKNYTVIKEVTGVTPPNNEYYELADTLRDIMSTYNREMQITAAVLNQAEADAPKSGWDTSKFYTIQKDAAGKVELVTADSGNLTASIQTQATDENGTLLFDEDNNPIYIGNTASSIYKHPEYNDYEGSWLVGDGQPPNGAPFAAGIAFPLNASEGYYYLRTDYLPRRLFRFNGTRWVKMEDNVRMTMSNMGFNEVTAGGSPDDVFLGKDVRQTQKGTFVNNNNSTVINGKTVPEKQSLSKALRPKADN
jgi:hypothetical protein